MLKVKKNPLYLHSLFRRDTFLIFLRNRFWFSQRNLANFITKAEA